MWLPRVPCWPRAGPRRLPLPCGRSPPRSADWMKWLAPSRRADGSTVAHGSHAVCSPQEEEPAMEHCAIDLGGRKSQVCVRASDGTILHESRPDTLALKEFLQGRPKSRVIVETCAEAFGIADAALALGHEVRVVSATLVRTLGVGARRTKTDRRDAQTLSEVSCRIDLPSVHVPGQRSREVKTICAVELIWNDPSTVLIACSAFSLHEPKWSRPASGQAARSTVDHSDIRGSSARLAVMVVIRRELPRTRC